MAITRRKIDTTFETDILKCYITNAEFIKQTYDFFKSLYFDVEYIPTIIQWCIDYYVIYEKAPDMLIYELFEQWAADHTKDEEVAYIESFLDKVTEELADFNIENIDYFIDKTLTYYEKRNMLNFADNIKEYANADEIEYAKQLYDEYTKVEKVSVDGTDPFKEPDKVEEAFENIAEPLFKLQGALGNLVNNELTRSGFVCIMGDTKRGKTWRLMDWAMVAHTQGLNVAYFMCGDMSKDQFLRRQAIWLTGVSDMEEYCKESLLPILDCEYNQKNTCERAERKCDFGIYMNGEKCTFKDIPEYIPCTECAHKNTHAFKGASWYKIKPETSIQTKKLRSSRYRKYSKWVSKSNFKIEAYPRRTMTVEQLEHVLTKWEEQLGCPFDVVCFDSIELIACKGKFIEREIQGEVAGAINALAKKKNCLALTVTQADSSSYNQDTLNMSNFSEASVKNTHFTALFTLNQSKEEEDQGIMRMGKLFGRETARTNHHVKIGYSLSIGRPHLFSYD